MKHAFVILIIVVGVAVLTGFDKKLETYILDAGYGATIQLEQNLIERFAPNTSMQETKDKTHEVITLAGGCFW
jgi:ABC-type lipoprotein release transport system permease subunit